MLFCRNKQRRCTEVNLEYVREEERRSEIFSKSVAEYEIDEDIVTYPKSKEEESLIRCALEQNEFLWNILQEKKLKKFIECMYSQKVTEGEVIIREGELGSHLYISNEGTYKIFIGDVCVNTFDDVRVFGELAILYSAKRHATIKAVENGSLWVLDCPTFKRLVIKTAMEEQEEKVSFLSNVPALSTASREKLYQVANLLQTEFYSDSKQIVKQAEIGDKFYIIRAGSVYVIKDNEKVATLAQGDYFGELALLKDEFRQATVIAEPPGTECLTLVRNEFINHFGDIEHFIKIKKEPIIQTEKIAEFTNLELHDLNIIQTIGIGAYGRVQLAQHNKHKNLIFALKYMKKADICRKSHQDQVFQEKDLHMSCECSFITKMYRTYRDSKYLYFLLEVCLGGDLWGHLHRQKKRYFEEDAAKFYSGCVLEGLTYLHKLGIIYRDLKPENILVHHSGYLKLADFGFAKKNNAKEKTYTFVGTAEYVAPEIIQNKGYNLAVDYWALGVFIFELLVGRTPFKTRDPGHLSTYKLIMKGIDNVIFPNHVSRKAKSLIKKLCAPFASSRLGCLRGGDDDIRNHSWYLDFDWDKLRSFDLCPPFRPVLHNNVDTRYFEKYPDDKNIPPDDFSGWDCEF